ncbi:MAG: MFS transporter, partial [Stackebrandtia sp.]
MTARDAAVADKQPEPSQAPPGDLRMSLMLWPILAAASMGILPFTVFATFLVPIAEGAESDIATVGSLRGLGGLATLVVGVALAPL